MPRRREGLVQAITGSGCSPSIRVNVLAIDGEE
jgi:hypothetical protein